MPTIKPLHLWTKRRILKNKNMIAIFNGETGSGKTYGALRFAVDLAEEFGTPFSVEGNVGFDFTVLLEKMMREENKQSGSVFLMEEVGSVGSGASSREWQSKANKFFFSFLQTSRHRNQIFLMTCPSFSYLEKGARELVHCQLEALGINMSKQLSFFKPFVLQVNRRTGKIFFKYLRFKQGGLPRKMNRVSFALPPQDIVTNYERAKLQFTTKLNENIITPLTAKPAHKIKVDPELINLLKENGYTIEKSAEILNVCPATIKYHRKNFVLAKKTKK